MSVCQYSNVIFGEIDHHTSEYPAASTFERIDRMAANSASSSSSSENWRHDVFLSFHGEDVRTSFADCLYYALKVAGVQTYRDEDELPKGHEISPQLIDAIENSQISIPIFSKRYTSSKWCLNELVKIVECKKTKNQMVCPIFYKIEPRDVRNKKKFDANSSREYKMGLNKYQKGLIKINAKIFGEHQKEEPIVQQWKKALKEVGELDGWHLKEHTYEGKLIHQVVKTVQIILQKRLPIAANNLIGIQSHKEKMLELLHIESEDRKFIWVHGPGGIGKTTIARAVYSEIFSHFEEYRFIEDVREKAQKHRIEYVQNQLITNIMEEKSNITDKFVGISLIKQRFHNRKVLIVLDDVDKSDQVKFLVEDAESFGIGSRVIVTSRNKDIIVAGEPKIYEPQLLDLNDSLVLFSHYAFGTDEPPIDYLDLSRKVVKTTGGLPLALQIVGSALSLRKISEWEGVLKKLQKFPNAEVIKSLEVSYDELDDEEKQIFLDVACHLIGMDKDIACYFWEGFEFFAREGLRTLCVRSLLMINEYNELRMHDLLRDFGRHIVYKENEHVEKRSRIWSKEEAAEVLGTLTGLSTVKGLHVQPQPDNLIPSEGLASMTELSLLHIDEASFFNNELPERNSLETITNSFSKLRWLCWRAFRPSEYQLANFRPKMLVILDLSHSEMSDEWIGWKQIKVADRLKVLDLTGCGKLSRTPDVSGNRRLELLILKVCGKLKVIDKSIYDLGELVNLDMSDCPYLKDLPSKISQLTSLKSLDLSGCERLGEFRNELWRLISLESLKLKQCHRLQKLPEELSCMASLTTLDMSDNKRLMSIPSLPSRLTSLDISECHSLQDISALPSSLTRLHASRCSSLVTLCAPGGLRNLKRLDLGHCSSLEEIRGVDKELDSLVDFNIEGCESLKKIPKLRGSKYLRTLTLDNNQSISDFEGEGMDSLKALEVENCKSLRKIPYLQDSKSFRKLEIIGCPVLSEIEHLEYYECLQELTINGVTSLERLPDDLSMLKELRTLKIAGSPLIPRLSYLPNNLSNLYIEGCDNLSEICGLDRLEFLETLDISWCKFIERLPNLSNFQNLVTLKVTNCEKLTEIQTGNGLMDSLKILVIGGCTSLVRLPDLSNFQNLKCLTVTYCERLTDSQAGNGLKFPCMGVWESLQTVQVPPDFEEFVQVWDSHGKSLRINGSAELSKINKNLRCHESLQELWITEEATSLEGLPANLSMLKELRILQIRYCSNLTHIPGLGGLESLRELTIVDCPVIPRLSELPKKMSNLNILRCQCLREICGFDGLEFLERLHILDCESLERLHSLPENLKHLVIHGCQNLTEIQGIGNLGFLERLDISACGSLKILDLSNLQNLNNLKIANFKNPTGDNGLEFLKTLKIIGCKSLERLPDLSNFKNLEELNIGCCMKLTEIQAVDECLCRSWIA